MLWLYLLLEIARIYLQIWFRIIVQQKRLVEGEAEVIQKNVFLMDKTPVRPDIFGCVVRIVPHHLFMKFGKHITVMNSIFIFTYLLRFHN